MLPRSCDTMVALGSATANGQTVFGKNSDRPADECQPLVQHPRRAHAPGAVTHCQFVDLPESAVTYRHVGSRPYWCWGYEHGFNEHQVVIGNEAVFSRFAQFSEPKLVGMELIRLGLERSRTAGEAVQVMTELVSRYGQGKFANDADVMTYDNSYIVADPREAYVIETAGHEWAVKQVEGTVGISNLHSIDADWSSLSPTAERRAVESGWWQAGSDRFDFARAYAVPRDYAAAQVLRVVPDAAEDWSASDYARHLAKHEGPIISEKLIEAVITQCHDAAWRCARSNDLLQRQAGSISAGTMMGVLGDHGHGSAFGEPLDTTIAPGRSSLCLHRRQDGSGSNTAASVVADLCSDGSRLPVYWCSFYSPCLGFFLPVFMEGELPKVLSKGSATAGDFSPWWRFRELSRAVYADIENRVPIVRAYWAPLQESCLAATYTVARQGRRLLDLGREAKATRLLTDYMDLNTTTMLDGVAELLDHFRR
jgi:secernin